MASGGQGQPQLRVPGLGLEDGKCWAEHAWGRRRVPQSPIRVGAGWGDSETALAPVPGGGAGLGMECLWGSGHSRVWAGSAAAAGAGRVLTAEQMPVIL